MDEYFLTGAILDINGGRFLRKDKHGTITKNEVQLEKSTGQHLVRTWCPDLVALSVVHFDLDLYSLNELMVRPALETVTWMLPKPARPVLSIGAPFAPVIGHPVFTY